MKTRLGYEVTQGQAQVGELSFPYLEQGDGPLLLCLHGFPDSPQGFSAQLPFFAAQGYRVVAPFMRGYAASARPQRRYQPAAFGQDVLGIMDALGAQSACLYGHDWGTAGAYAAAVLAPERIEKLVASAVPYGPGMAKALLINPEQQRRSWYMFFFQTILADMAVPINDFALIERLWQDWSPGGFPAEPLEAAKAVLSEPGALTAVLSYYRTALDPTLRDPGLEGLEQRIGREAIKVPSMYLHGEDDGCIGPEVAEDMELLFTRDLVRETLFGVGHFPHIEAPERFNARVLRFLQTGL